MMWMQRLMRVAVIALAMMWGFGVSCASAQVAVQTSHVGAVTSIAYHWDTASVVSGGSDGRIKVWDTEARRIVRSLQAGSHPIVAMDLHPEEPHVALVSAPTASEYMLQVWDWQAGEQLFTKPLDAMPLVLDYAPSGSFILVSEARISGVRYFHARTGRELRYPSVPQGIVTYATVASSERTLMTYVAADGSIRYWDLSGRSVIGEARTLPELGMMSVLENKRYAVAVHTGDLVVVDIVNGSLMDRIPVGQVEYLTVAPNGEIVLLESRAAGRRVSVYEFDGEFLNRMRVHRNEALDAMNVVVLAAERLYGGSDKGELYVFRSTDNRERRLVRNVVEPIYDIALTGDTLYVNTGARISAISSDFFTDPDEGLSGVERVESREVDNPVEGPVRMKTLSDGTMLLWGVEGDNASRLFRLRQGRFIRDRFEEELTTEADIHVLAEFDDTLLLLTRADNVFQYQLPDLERIFRYSALGLETVVGTERYGIVVGKSRTDAFDAAVLTIDPVTRETVPLETETFLVYDLEYDRSKGHLYALGITRNGGTHTTVTRFSGSANLTRRTELYRVRGEYLEGDLAVDPVTGALYTSVGPSGITRITEEETETHAGASHAPTRLESSGGFLWAHNRDGSVTLWNPERAQIVGDLYFFEDEGWALLTEEGRFYASSPQAEEFIQAVSASGNTESLQLTLPEE